MKYKQKIGLLFASSVTAVTVTILLYYSVVLDFCSTRNPCADYIETLFWILLLPLCATALPLFLLLFCKEAVYHTWKWFAIPYILLLAFLAWPHGKPSGGGLYDGYVGGVVDKESVLLILAGLFVFISSSLSSSNRSGWRGKQRWRRRLKTGSEQNVSERVVHAEHPLRRRD